MRRGSRMDGRGCLGQDVHVRSLSDSRSGSLVGSGGQGAQTSLQQLKVTLQSRDLLF